MLGAVHLGHREVALREFPMPEPRHGEVVVAVRASGICGSDLNYYRGPSPEELGQPVVVAGHEPAGVVHAIGPGVSQEDVAVGDRVMVHHYVGCGRCGFCRSGWPQMCSTQTITVLGKDAHGSHAPFISVPASTLVPLRNELSFVAGAAIACGTGTAWGGLDRLGDIGGATLVVYGQGPVGLSATMLAAARGARVIAVDLAPARLEKAAEFGATETLNGREVDTPSAVRDLTDGLGADLVLETSGSSAAAADALDSLQRWGRGCFVGIGAEVRLDVSKYLRKQLTLMTSWSMSIQGQIACADFITRHALPIDALVTDEWSLDQVVEAYAVGDGQTAAGKGVIVFDG